MSGYRMCLCSLPSSCMSLSYASCASFYTNLPPKYLLTELNMYAQKDQHILGAVVSLHLFYHAALCDLTRISLPGFNFPLAVAFQKVPVEFALQCQEVHTHENKRKICVEYEYKSYRFEFPKYSN